MGLELHSSHGRQVLVAMVLGSGLASVDATAVNVALPAIGRDLGGSMAAMQWIVNAYTLTLAAFLLFGGALGDRYGRRRVFLVGVIWFTAASLACALAPSARLLLLGRALQGVGGALLAPASLAILQASFREEDRGAAIGAWSGLGGVALAVGPVLGGYLIQAVSWRLIFLLNVPIAFVVVRLTRKFVPETRDPTAGPVDVAGVVLAVLGLSGITFSLIEAGERGWRATEVVVGFIVGAAASSAFLVVESRRAAPMLDLALFRRRPFGAANAETLVVYAALGGGLLFLPMQLQLVLHYSPLGAGAALLPTTAAMLLLSTTMGRLAQRIGPRLPMTIGPLVAAAGFLFLARIDETTSYAQGILPGATILGIGLSMTVAPLTATVLAAAPPEKAGTASAINNVIARTGSLLAVALLPAAAGLGGIQETDSAHFALGYRRAMNIAAAGCACGALIAWLRVRRPARFSESRTTMGCPLDAPALHGTYCR